MVILVRSGDIFKKGPNKSQQFRQITSSHSHYFSCKWFLSHLTFQNIFPFDKQIKTYFCRKSRVKSIWSHSNSKILKSSILDHILYIWDFIANLYWHVQFSIIILYCMLLYLKLVVVQSCYHSCPSSLYPHTPTIVYEVQT